VLEAITRILRARGLVAPDEEVGFNVRLISEHLLHVVAHARGGASFHVKVKACGSLPDEYRNYSDAARMISGYVPEILAHEYINDREVIVIRGVAHRPALAAAGRRDRRALGRQLVRFFDAASIGARVSVPVEPHRAYLRGVEERATDRVCAAIAREWIENEHLDRLPHIRQHGDFVMNNLGLPSTGLVVFDWEDFGRISLPGLDVCTLLSSDTRFDAARFLATVDESQESPDGPALVVRQSLPGMGLTPVLFRQLVPLYLILFLDLKLDYGVAITTTVRNLVHDIVQRRRSGARPVEA